MTTIASIKAREFGSTALPALELLRPERGCTAALRALLKESQEPLTFEQIWDGLKRKWPKHYISAALSKLIAWGYVVWFPPEDETKIRGRRYAATTRPSRYSRKSRVQPRDVGSGAGVLSECRLARKRAGYWDGLVPAFETCDA